VGAAAAGARRAVRPGAGAAARPGRALPVGRRPRTALPRTTRPGELERLWRSFPREQVLVLQFERCVADPIRELRRTYAFLGLDADVVPPDPERPRHVTHDDRPELPSEVHAALLRELADDLRRLRELVPDLDPERWPSSLGADRAAALPFADTPSGDAPTTST
jgi:hypothetical protein